MPAHRLPNVIGPSSHQPGLSGYGVGKGFLSSVTQHVAEEEAEIFAAARELLGVDRLRQIGAQMAARKTALRAEMADTAR